VFQKVVAALMESIGMSLKVALGDDADMIYVTNVQVLVSSESTAELHDKYTADQLMDGRRRRLSLFVVVDKRKPIEKEMKAEAKEGDTQGTALSGCLAMFGVCSLASLMMFWRFVEDGHNPYPHYFIKNDRKDKDVTMFVRAAATYGFGRTDQELEEQIKTELGMVSGSPQERKEPWEKFLRGKEKFLLTRRQAIVRMEKVPQSVS
jgi:hypothetical protein